jgi:hypothetical protein
MESSLLADFEDLMMIKQQRQYCSAPDMMTMGFCSKQMKEDNRVINPTPNQV